MRSGVERPAFAGRDKAQYNRDFPPRNWRGNEELAWGRVYCVYNVNQINICGISCDYCTAMETKTARLTILIDPVKKKAFEGLCAAQDLTPSQVVRQLIREYLERHDVDYATKPRSSTSK